MLPIDRKNYWCHHSSAHWKLDLRWSQSITKEFIHHPSAKCYLRNHVAGQEFHRLVTDNIGHDEDDKDGISFYGTEGVGERGSDDTIEEEKEEEKFEIMPTSIFEEIEAI